MLCLNIMFSNYIPECIPQYNALFISKKDFIVQLCYIIDDINLIYELYNYIANVYLVINHNYKSNSLHSYDNFMHPQGCLLGEDLTVSFNKKKIKNIIHDCYYYTTFYFHNFGTFDYYLKCLINYELGILIFMKIQNGVIQGYIVHASNDLLQDCSPNLFEIDDDICQFIANNAIDTNKHVNEFNVCDIMDIKKL